MVEHERTGLIVRDGDYAIAVRRLLDRPALGGGVGSGRPGEGDAGIFGGKNGGIDSQRVQ